MIQPNATAQEKTSPFYTANEEFCREFEDFIEEKGGEVQGNYNAWSFTVYGKITRPKNWILQYKKATFSGAHILLSSKYQNLLTLAEWTTLRTTENSGFLIRKRSWTDFFKSWFFKSLKRLKVSDRYVIISKEDSSPFISKLTKVLTPLFQTGEVYKIENRKGKLIIELRTDQHHFDIFNLITQLE